MVQQTAKLQWDLPLPGDGIFNQFPEFLEKQKRVKTECGVDRDLGLNHTAY